MCTAPVLLLFRAVPDVQPDRRAQREPGTVCAACRLPYEVYEKGRRLGEPGEEYPLSPKDMCTVELLPEILRAGVTSLKIEGRMKKPEYTAGVVSIYRKYLDLYEENPGRYRVLPEDLKKLYDIYNRDGFNQSYYKVRNGREMIALKNEKQIVGSRRGRRNEQLFYEIQKNYLETQPKEPISGCLTLCKGAPAVLTVYAGDACVTVEKEGIQKAQKQPLTEERVRARWRRPEIRRSGSNSWIFLWKTMFFVPMQFLSELRREAMERLEQELVLPFRRTEPKKAPADSCQDGRKKAEDGQGTENIRVTALAETGNQLRVLLETSGLSAVYADLLCFSKEYYMEEAAAAISRAKSQGKEFWLALPHAVRDGQLNPWRDRFRELIQEGLDGFLVRNLESYAFLQEAGLGTYAAADYSIYTMNHEAQRFLEERNIVRDTVPLELNQYELARRDNSRSEMIVYGYLPMMVSASA